MRRPSQTPAARSALRRVRRPGTPDILLPLCCSLGPHACQQQQDASPFIGRPAVPAPRMQRSLRRHIMAVGEPCVRKTMQGCAAEHCRPAISAKALLQTECIHLKAALLQHAPQAPRVCIRQHNRILRAAKGVHPLWCLRKSPPARAEQTPSSGCHLHALLACLEAPAHRSHSVTCKTMHLLVLDF